MHRLARDLETASLRAQHLAPALDAALDHLGRQLAICDGWPASTGDPKVTTSIASTVEPIAAMRFALGTHREELRDAVTSLHAALGELDWLIQRSYRLDVDPRPAVDPTPVVPLCRDGLAGKDGSIDWGDPTCTMPAIKAGLCGAHYHRWRRWRQRAGIDTTRDFAPAG